MTIVKNKIPSDTSRRKFIAQASLSAAGVLALGTFVGCNPIRRTVLGMAETTIPPYNGAGTKANLWLEITTENQLIIHSSKVEMGQGTFTGFAQIVADELDFNMAQISVIAAETDSGIIDGLSTGGSLSVAQLFNPLREMAATMRAFIKQEAGKKLAVDAQSLKTADGVVLSKNKQLTYAAALAGVENWDLPKTPKLRPTSQYKLVGKPIPRIDLLPKVIGEPIFGMDATMPNMLYATVIKPEHIGSKIKTINSSEAEKMPGEIKVLKKDDWVGIIANSFTEALAAKNKVKVTWDIPKLWTEENLRDYLKVGKGKHMVTQKEGKALTEDEADVFELEFTSPIGAHAQIEPNAAVAFVHKGKAVVKLSTQVIGVTQTQVADALGFKKEAVNIIGTYLGGGFGRRLNTSHAVQTALMSKEVGQPVKYLFTRKEEFQNDTFRPPTHHIIKGKAAADGKLTHLEHHYASGDVAINSVIVPPVLSKILGTDFGAMRGGNIMYDKIPNHRAEQWHKTLPFATSWWRSLGLLANTFVIESFIDEMALKAKLNPVNYRLNMLGTAERAHRIKKVIELAAEKGNYSDAVNGNTAMGIAASIDTGSACAHVIEASVINNKIKVEKVTCVLDCGLAVNPDQVKAQCEGSIIMGISACLHEKMTIKDGRLYPINYGAYQMALMRDTPKQIDVHLVEGGEKPLPVGEPPLGPIGAAIGNALRRITGKRLTDLPMQLS